MHEYILLKLSIYIPYTIPMGLGILDGRANILNASDFINIFFLVKNS
jgi:hypothetical protein